MCGILLHIGNEQIAPNHSALECIAHRGPDAFGTENFDLGSFNVALGHRRLSIIDLSERGKQPMSYADGNLWITYNGEIYNYREIRQTLEVDGYKFQSDSDTEVLLAAYDKWGEQCIEKFNGMFAFALFDRRKNSIFIARDRFGIKPLYFHNSPKGFSLVSEIKQIAKFAHYQPSVNNEKLYHYLNSGDFSFDKETLWNDIFELEGGHCLTIPLSQWKPGDILNISRWYTPPFDETPLNISFEDACCEFRRLLDESVKMRLRADVNVGFLLSGGLDSSTLVGLAHNDSRYENNRLRTYSSCYDDSSIDERKFINAMLEFSGADSFLHFPTPQDFQENMDKVIWHNDIPVRFGSPTPHWLIYQYIKNEKDNRKVIIEGQGADEILCGYGDFHWAFLYENMKLSKFPTFLKELTAFQKRHHEPLKILLRKYQRIRFQKSVKYPANPIINTNYLLGNNEIPSIAIKREEPTIRELHKDRMTILRYILHNVDRGSMAGSRETRVPFLDHNLVEFCLKLPSEHKISDGFTKRVLRESVKDVLPETISRRTDKQGYSSPVKKWAENELHAFFENNLKEAMDLPFVNKDAMMKNFANFAKGSVGFDPVWWRIVATHHWMKMFKIKA